MNVIDSQFPSHREIIEFNWNTTLLAYFTYGLEINGTTSEYPNGQITGLKLH